MCGVAQKNIEAARRITVMQYLETYHPGELVRKTDREYCTRTHDSLIITPANGFFHWFSRHVGGNNAIDYLTKVEGIQRNLRYVPGVYVQADADFTAQLVYTAPDGSTLTKTLQVAIDRNATAEYPFPDSEIATFAERPTPAVTSGKITKVAKVNGTWLIWFNGEEAYCCTHGANGQPAGCPPYTYVNTSTVSADQCVPGDHYGNQIRIWGGLNQLSLGDADDLPTVFSADEGEEISLLDFCASIYDDVQMYIIENFPESTAAEIYLASADELANGVETYASARGYYTYIYNPGRAGWQTVALIGPEIGEEEPEPEPVVQEYYASWEAPAQTASGSFDFSYGVRTDKIQTATLEKVDGATIEIEPITKSGSIDGGSWSVSPASKQTVTTSGHTADDNYQKNGGDAAASWSLHCRRPDS